MTKRKTYRCCRCNEELKPGENYVTRERTVTRHQWYSGRPYKIRAFPRYHADETVCARIMSCEAVQ